MFTKNVIKIIEKVLDITKVVLNLQAYNTTFGKDNTYLLIITYFI